MKLIKLKKQYNTQKNIKFKQILNLNNRVMLVLHLRNSSFAILD